jgi:phospholipid/cholesterol/gamma-HCH transport system permease protein
MPLGGILAFAGAVQLRKFGADIYIAALVGVAMTREMAALMTAIVMSGRTVGAYASQIATMTGNEEIDARRAIGIPVCDYLILPKGPALTFMMPLLHRYGCAVGIFGGFVVAVSMLNVSSQAFIEQARLSLTDGQILFDLPKSVAFGALIAIVGCRCGLKSGRGGAGCGVRNLRSCARLWTDGNRRRQTEAANRGPRVWLRYVWRRWYYAASLGIHCSP